MFFDPYKKEPSMAEEDRSTKIVWNISLPEIIQNKNGLYEGDLKCYFKIIFYRAHNLLNPYHNFRHIFHVVGLCYQACIFYEKELSPREMRNLLIAAMFHDFNHPGRMGNDDLNIELALRGLREYILTQDAPFIEGIEYLMKATEFPHKKLAEGSLEADIIRDADLGQVFSVAWIQQILFGLGAEWNKNPLEILKMQVGFIAGLQFSTEWGKQMFSPEEIQKKLAEVDGLIQILD